MKRDRLTDRMQRHNAAASGSAHRQITDDFKYDKKKLKHLKHILHNVTVAMGTLSSAHHEFSRIKGPDISPDGMLGGLGYIMPVKEIKDVINTSIKNLSDVADSLADELTNPNWDAGEDEDVQKLIKEKEEVEETAEEEGEPAEESSEEPEEKPEGESEEEPEEKPEEETPPEPQPEKTEETGKESSDISPEDVVTAEIAKRASIDEVLGAAVRQSLVRFSSIGTRKN